VTPRELKDALHVACAKDSDAEYFLTCDDQLLKKKDKLKLDFLMMNPVEYTLRLRAEDEN
jgi:predicted nucleic acid-binding protein